MLWCGRGNGVGGGGGVRGESGRGRGAGRSHRGSCGAASGAGGGRRGSRTRAERPRRPWIRASRGAASGPSRGCGASRLARCAARGGAGAADGDSQLHVALARGRASGEGGRGPGSSSFFRLPLAAAPEGTRAAPGGPVAHMLCSWSPGARCTGLARDGLIKPRAGEQSEGQAALLPKPNRPPQARCSCKSTRPRLWQPSGHGRAVPGPGGPPGAVRPRVGLAVGILDPQGAALPRRASAAVRRPPCPRDDNQAAPLTRPAPSPALFFAPTAPPSSSPSALPPPSPPWPAWPALPP